MNIIIHKGNINIASMIYQHPEGLKWTNNTTFWQACTATRSSGTLSMGVKIHAIALENCLALSINITICIPYDPEICLTDKCPTKVHINFNKGT